MSARTEVRYTTASWPAATMVRTHGVAASVPAVSRCMVAKANSGTLNLIANALGVAPEGSAITLRARRAGHDAVEIHVIDEGPGMSAAQRARAFDRFWRAPRAGHDGFGLGLAIVDRLVSASGGTVELRTAPGGGLDAQVRLRVAPPGDRATGSSVGVPGTAPEQRPDQPRSTTRSP